MNRIVRGVMLTLVLLLCGMCVGSCSRKKDESSPRTSSSSQGDRIYQSVDQMPRQINQVPLIYPKDAQEAKIEGTTHVKMLIGADGNVQDAEVSVSSGSASLDQAALRAAKQCKFTPGLVDDAPVRMWLYKTFTFKLSQIRK